MDQPLPPALGWPLTTSRALALIAAVVVAVFLWRHHVDTNATLRRMDANQERDRRLAEIRDRLYLESLSEERRAQELEWRHRLAERERRAREILDQEEASKGDGNRWSGMNGGPPRRPGGATGTAGPAKSRHERDVSAV